MLPTDHLELKAVYDEFSRLFRWKVSNAYEDFTKHKNANNDIQRQSAVKAIQKDMQPVTVKPIEI
jgi:hypothetical protein